MNSPIYQRVMLYVVIIIVVVIGASWLGHAVKDMHCTSTNTISNTMSTTHTSITVPKEGC